MNNDTITRREIEELYRKVNADTDGQVPISRLNLGTMNNELMYELKGSKRLTESIVAITREEE